MNGNNLLTGQYVITEQGVPLAVFETGNPSGPPIVLLHGFGYNHACFQPQFQSDLAKDYRLVAIDLRGHGYSGKPLGSESYRGTQVWADDLEVVLDALNVTNATLVGWSYGAMVCMDWVRHYGPGRAKKFVFTGSHGGLTPYSSEELKNKIKMNEDLQKLTPNFGQDIQNTKAFIEKMIHGSISDEMREILELSRHMLPLYAVEAMGSRAFENSDLKESIKRPVLFVQGEHDFANPPKIIQSVAQGVPLSRVQVIPDTGHIPSMEAPEQFNAVLRTFAAEDRPA